MHHKNSKFSIKSYCQYIGLLTFFCSVGNISSAQVQPPIPAQADIGASEILGVSTISAPGFDVELLPASIDAERRLYLAEPVPIAFVIEKNGSYATWWSCSDSSNCDLDMKLDLENAVNFCEERMLGAECRLAMIGKTAVAEMPPFKTELTYNLSHGNGLPIWDPSEAAGKIYFFPGYNGWSYDRPNEWREETDGTVPRIVSGLGAMKWDVDVVNILPFDRNFLWGETEYFARTASELIDQARAEGYSRVAFIGHSRGGYEISLILGGGAKPDAVLLLEPDTMGPVQDKDGSSNPQTAERISTIADGLSQAPDVPVMLAYFSNSGWFSPVPKGSFAKVLDSHVLFIELAKPDGYAGHTAGLSERFNRQYRDCLSKFLSGGLLFQSECHADPVDETDQSNFATRLHLTSNGYSPITKDDWTTVFGKFACSLDPLRRELSNSGFCVVFTANISIYVEEEFGVFISADGNLGDVILPAMRATASVKFREESSTNIAEVEYTDGGYCKFDRVAYTAPETCFSVFINGNYIAISNDSDQSLSMLRFTDRDSLPETNWVCQSNSDGYDCW